MAKISKAFLGTLLASSGWFLTRLFDARAWMSGPSVRYWSDAVRLLSASEFRIFGLNFGNINRQKIVLIIYRSVRISTWKETDFQPHFCTILGGQSE